MSNCNYTRELQFVKSTVKVGVQRFDTNLGTPSGENVLMDNKTEKRKLLHGLFQTIFSTQHTDRLLSHVSTLTKSQS